MIKHIVMYCLREDCDKAAAIEEIRSSLEPLAGIIPGVPLALLIFRRKVFLSLLLRRYITVASLPSL